MVVVDKAIESIVETAKERLASPYFGSLAISWSLYNWRVFIILTFGDPKNDRLTAIENLLFGDAWSHIHHIGVPIASSLLYVYIAPRIKGWYERYVHGIDIDTRNKKRIADGHDLLSVEDVEKIKVDYEEQLRNANVRFERINEQFNSYRSENPDLRDIGQRNRALCILLLKLIDSGKNRRNLIVQLVNECQSEAVESTRINTLLAYLVKYNMIYAQDSSDNPIYIMKPEGYKFLMDVEPEEQNKS